MDAVFYITFAPLNHPVTHVGFYIDHEASWDELADDLIKCMYDLEKTYGDFDWTVSQMGGNSFGCISYLEPSKHEDVMRAVRQTISDYTLGPLCKINAYTMDIPEILHTTQQAYERQKAQQLRDKLSAYVDKGSVASPKKM